MENSRPIRGQYPGHVITADPSEAIESPNPVTHWNNDYGHGQAGVNMLQNMKIAISKQSICYVEENETENSLIVIQYVAEKSRLAAIISLIRNLAWQICPRKTFCNSTVTSILATY